MKKFLTVTLTIALVFALALATTACDDGNDKGKDDQKEEPHVPQPKTITQDNGLAFTGKVIIKTSDLYLEKEWDAVVANVITALNAAYEAVEMKIAFDFAFGSDGLQIVLAKDLATDWEVKKTLPEGTGVKGILHIKTGSINSITASSYETGIMSVGTNNPSTSQA